MAPIKTRLTSILLIWVTKLIAKNSHIRRRNLRLFRNLIYFSLKYLSCRNSRSSGLSWSGKQFVVVMGSWCAKLRWTRFICQIFGFSLPYQLSTLDYHLVYSRPGSTVSHQSVSSFLIWQLNNHTRYYYYYYYQYQRCSC